MDLNITLANTSSDPKVLAKSYTNIATTVATPYGSMSILKPILRLRYEPSIWNPADINYAWIAELNRFYFVGDKRILSGDIVEMDLTVDPLMSYGNAILASSGICVANEFAREYRDMQKPSFGTYMADPNRPIYPYPEQKIYEFDAGDFNLEQASSYSRNFVLNVSGGEGE